MIAALSPECLPATTTPVSTKLEKDTVYMPSSVAARVLGNGNVNRILPQRTTEEDGGLRG